MGLGQTIEERSAYDPPCEAYTYSVLAERYDTSLDSFISVTPLTWFAGRHLGSSLAFVLEYLVRRQLCQLMDPRVSARATFHAGGKARTENGVQSHCDLVVSG